MAELTAVGQRTALTQEDARALRALAVDALANGVAGVVYDAPGRIEWNAGEG